MQTLKPKRTEVDPITLEVLRGRLSAAADEMQFTLLKSSFSSVITEALDATCAVFDARGRTIAQACAIPVHLGVLSELGRRFAARYPSENASPGDLYIVNDPYAGGTHLPDIGVAAPVFSRGELVGYVATMTHHQDIGGAAPGSGSASVHDHFAEGIRIPMIRLATAGVLDEDVVSLMTANSRSPSNLRGDLEAQIAACRTGEHRLEAVFEDRGIDLVNVGIDALMDYAERLTRLAIESIPDGVYTFSDWLDDNGLSADTDPVEIRVTLRISGSDADFDFTGTGGQVKAAINNVPASTLAAVYYAIRVLTGEQAPNNDGCYRPISVYLPPGTIVNPEFPAPINARGVALCRIIDTVLGAMAMAAPERMTAAGCGQTSVIPVGGFDPDTGRHYVGILGGPYRGGMGARPSKDGIDVCDHDLSNVYHVPLEITEGEFPVRYRKLELWQDSGGAGTWRGGLGYHVELELLRGEAVLSLRRERHKFSPWGVRGGGNAAVCRTEIEHAGGAIESLPAKIVQPLLAGERLRYWTTGGGGYGSPLQRPPELVLADVLDSKISPAAARDSYGVTLNAHQVDEAMTVRLRGKLSGESHAGA